MENHIATMATTKNKIDGLLAQLADIWCCDPGDFTGRIVGDLLRRVDSPEYPVMWGCWTEAELEIIV